MDRRSDQQTDARTDARADGRTDARTDGRTDGRTGGQTGGRTNGRTDGRASRRTGKRTAGRTDERTNGRREERTKGRTCGRTGGLADGRTNGQTGGRTDSIVVSSYERRMRAVPPLDYCSNRVRLGRPSRLPAHLSHLVRVCFHASNMVPTCGLCAPIGRCQLHSSAVQRSLEGVAGACCFFVGGSLGQRRCCCFCG